MKKLLFISFLLTVGLSGFGQKIEGEVYDRKEKTGLIGAPVWLEGTQIKVFSDSTGKFIIDNIPLGTYNLVTSFVGYGKTSITNIKINENTILTYKLVLPLPCEYEKNENNKSCPICQKQDKVVPITYGFQIGKIDKKYFYHNGCELTGCDPNWYCKRDKHKF